MTRNRLLESVPCSPLSWPCPLFLPKCTGGWGRGLALHSLPPSSDTSGPCFGLLSPGRETPPRVPSWSQPLWEAGPVHSPTLMARCPATGKRRSSTQGSGAASQLLPTTATSNPPPQAAPRGWPGLQRRIRDAGLLSKTPPLAIVPGLWLSPKEPAASSQRHRLMTALGTGALPVPQNAPVDSQGHFSAPSCHSDGCPRQGLGAARC